MVKKTRSSSYVELISHRKNSSSSLSVGLNLAQLEMLLCESIPLFSNDNDLTEVAKGYHGVAARHRADSSWAPDELNEVVTVLQHFLSSAPSLPSHLVFSVHCHLGCINLLQQKNDNAMQSFLRALWILASAHEPSLEQMGLCLHRLGISYGRNGNYRQAMNLLTKAMAEYDASSLNKDHPCVVSARDDLAHFRELVGRTRPWASLPPTRFTPLTSTLEDGTTITTLQRRVSYWLEGLSNLQSSTLPFLVIRICLLIFYRSTHLFISPNYRYFVARYE